jgi:taurine dioxygenase
MEIEPLNNVMGAEVRGLDLNQSLDKKTTDELYQAFLEHLLLCIRDQSFADVGAFLDAAKHFGAPKKQHMDSFRVDGHPEAGTVTSEDRDVNDGKRIIRGTMFHTDESFIAVPPKATILYAVDVPSTGGDTRFVNMQAAFEGLPDTTKLDIQGLTATHYYGKDRGGRKVPSLTDEQMRETPPVSHPIVRTHDETGAIGLYVHETMTDTIDGMEAPQSEALLRQLYDHSTENAAFQYRHKWRKGDFVIWDDRATLHAATADYDEKEKRLLYRTMLAGTPPR